MGQLKALSLAAAVALGAAGSASAADLLPPPPMPAPPPMMAPLDTSGWYIRADVGVGVNQLGNPRSTLQPFNADGQVDATTQVRAQTEIANSAIYGAGVGYQINNWFRADVTGEYRGRARYSAVENSFFTNPLTGVSTANALDNYSARLASMVGLVNGYVDLGTWYGLTPYLGAGVGFARHNFSGLTDYSGGAPGGVAADTSKTNFAWALMTGVAFSITPNIKLDLGYRYLDMGNLTSNPILCQQAQGCGLEQQSMHISSHDMRIGLRYLLAGGDNYAPVSAPALFAPPPGPLVRKY